MFEELLTPIAKLVFERLDADDQALFGNAIAVHTPGQLPSLEGVTMAIVGVPEGRGNPENKGCTQAPGAIRHQLYRLYHPWNNQRIVDLGDIKAGESVTDTYAALQTLVHNLLEQNIIPVVIGGSHDLGYAQFTAYGGIRNTVHVVNIDERIELDSFGQQFDASNFILKMLMEEQPMMTDYLHIGHQQYFTKPRAIETLRKLHFECYRLGMVRPDIEEAEPMLRNADMVMLDIAAGKQSDAPGRANATPHGFYGEELCRLARYAGISDKVTSFGIYEVNPGFDNQQQTVQLAAHIIWYFIEGVAQRKGDYPIQSANDFYVYHVYIDDYDLALQFWKSKKSDRWWVHLPGNGELPLESQLTPCSYRDYLKACDQEITERIIQLLQE